MLFEWDEAKNRSNIAKHGIPFPAAQEVFSDPHLVIDTAGVVDGQERFAALGMTANGIRTLFVVHCYPFRHDDVEIVRIISARLATRHEVRRYEKGLAS